MSRKTSAGILGMFAWAGLAGFAAGPGECAAQTRAVTERLSLSAAIEEARRSPFHMVAVPGSPEPSARRSGFDGPAAPGPLGSGPWQGTDDAPTIIWTFAAAGASHLVATYMFFGCALDDRSESVAGCLLAPIVPLLAVPFPALLAGAGGNRALGSSVAGLLAGGVAYYGAMMVTEAISNVNLLVASAASGLVHAGVVSAMLRQR